MSVRVFAPAKINLTLKVGPARADGLHPLESVVVFADAGDVVTAAPGEGLSLSIEGPFAAGLQADESNLVLRAARALATAAHIEPHAALTLEKNLPVASGIGGGSTDAAATLRALNQFWNLKLPAAELARIAQPLGADVPVCIDGVSAWMTGAGESFTPLHVPPLAAVLINPLKPLPTADVYRQFDRLGLGSELSGDPPSLPRHSAALIAIAVLGNDLEAPARALMPEVDEISSALAAEPRIEYAALSGSGATMFAIVADRTVADDVARRLSETRRDWWVRATQLGVGA